MELKLEVFIPQLKLTKRKDQSFVFDPCRSKYVLFTEEEMIRQLLIQLFISELNIPSGLISVERKIEINGIEKRYDLVIYSSGSAVPMMIVEVKKPAVPIDQSVLDQILIYNRRMEAPYLLLSNGIQNRLFNLAHDEILELKDWPKDWRKD